MMRPITEKLHQARYVNIRGLLEEGNRINAEDYYVRIPSNKPYARNNQDFNTEGNLLYSIRALRELNSCKNQGKSDGC